MLNDAVGEMGFDEHYVYHTSWAARKLRELDSVQHTDISSSLMFCGIVSSFIKVEHFDYRVPNLDVAGLRCGQANLISLHFEENSLTSLSCMHVLEHVGLGRYGDEISSDADRKAASELKRVLKPGGNLLIVVPMAEIPSIRFNAHRIYSYAKLTDLFNGLKLVEFSFYNDYSKTFHINTDESAITGSRYGCGCFVFRK